MSSLNIGAEKQPLVKSSSRKSIRKSSILDSNLSLQLQNIVAQHLEEQEREKTGEDERKSKKSTVRQSHVGEIAKRGSILNQLQSERKSTAPQQPLQRKSLVP